MNTIEFYYSDSCMECHQIRKLLMQMLPKNMKFKEINISYPEGQYQASELNIMSVPTIVINGNIALSGRITKEELLEEIQKTIE